MVIDDSVLTTPEWFTATFGTEPLSYSLLPPQFTLSPETWPT